jgi:hypothetical protein
MQSNIPLVNRIVVGLFLGSIILFISAVSLIDIFLYIFSSGNDTISWSMALFGGFNPFYTFAIGHISGAVVWGLAAHWWAGLPSLVQEEEVNKLKQHILELENKLKIISKPSDTWKLQTSCIHCGAVLEVVKSDVDWCMEGVDTIRGESGYWAFRCGNCDKMNACERPT